MYVILRYFNVLANMDILKRTKKKMFMSDIIVSFVTSRYVLLLSQKSQHLDISQSIRTLLIGFV